MALTAILDIDGTLVDTNYHHAIAWHRAFHRRDHAVQMWKIHRHVGMGGDQLIAALLGDAAEETEGDELRDAHGAAYGELIGEVEPIAGARELIEKLGEGGVTVVLASSAESEEVDHYLDLLEARDLVADWTTAADVERTKPRPDLVHAALAKVGADPGEAVMIGDTVWDVKAASAAGLPTLTVLTGGFSEAELRDAGAAAVVESIAELRVDPQSLESLPR
jgi:HAD superfamily hydrolase (TIGR01509 family)